MSDDFCPDYMNIGLKENPEYTFSIELDIKSTKKLTQVSAPEETRVLRNSEGTGASITYNQKIHDFTIFYKTSEMKYPHLVYAEDTDYPNEVAVLASFVPTFEPPAP